MFFEQVAKLADRAILVVGEGIEDHRCAARAVRFVGHLFVADAGLFAGAPANGALDVLGGHVGGFRVGDDRPQARIHVGVAATGARRHG